MRPSTIAALLLLAAYSRAALPQGIGSAGLVREVLRAEDARFAAMIRVDTAALAGMLADDLLYVHSSGRSETKAQFLTAVGSRSIRYMVFVPAERRVTLLSNSTALSTARANARVIFKGQQLSFEVRYIAVYSRASGRWRLRGWQTTRIAP
ncbi:MAG: nuclear transport factor 2 family protein [Gemmatimonadaceae bacterium]